MREIKFRAWDTWCKIDDDMPTAMVEEVHKVMIKLNGIVYNSEYGDDQIDRYILMQYTGLKDKNDVEIYEGDIILWYGGALKNIPIYSEVKWNREEARFSFGCKANSAYMFYNTEVVGNIYENQDLLKG